MTTSLSKQLFIVLVLMIGGYGTSPADAQKSTKPTPEGHLFEPVDQASERYVSKALSVHLDKHDWAPTIVVLRTPQALSESPIDVKRLKAQTSRIQRLVLADLGARDFRLIHQYSYVPGFAGHLTARGLEKLIRHPDVLGIDFDHQGIGHLDQSVPLIGADHWHSDGVTGEGALVAVLDTGVANHPDLDDDVVVELCMLSSNTANGGVPCPNGTGQQLVGDDAALDGQGHGTHVTGIITSSGTLAPQGVAPDAEIVAIKVLDDQDPSGTGQISDWIDGLEMVLTMHPAVDGPIDTNIVNMSLGVSNNPFVGNGDCEQPGTSGQLMAFASNILRDVGVLTVASSGNDGFSNGISFPACVSSIVAVGASNNNDQITGFTNSNANLDLLAPGNLITSTGVSNSGFQTLSGTSQAAPHAAACAALRVQHNPGVSPAQLLTILTNSPVLINNPANGLSFPRLWCQPPVQM